MWTVPSREMGLFVPWIVSVFKNIFFIGIFASEGIFAILANLIEMHCHSRGSLNDEWTDIQMCDRIWLRQHFFLSRRFSWFFQWLRMRLELPSGGTYTETHCAGDVRVKLTRILRSLLWMECVNGGKMFAVFRREKDWPWLEEKLWYDAKQVGNKNETRPHTRFGWLELVWLFCCLNINPTSYRMMMNIEM